MNLDLEDGMDLECICSAHSYDSKLIGCKSGLLPRRRLKVLIIASWYPNKEHPISGIFIKKYALAISKYCDVAVLYTHIGNIKNDIEISKINNILEVILYKQVKYSKNKFIYYLRCQIAQYLGFMHFSLIGYNIIYKLFGKPDLVHCNVILYSGLIALYLKLKYRIPYIITEHWVGYVDGTFNKRSFFGKILIKLIGKNAAAITTVSNSLKNAMIACGIKNKYFIIPNIVEIVETNNNLNNNHTKKYILHISLLNDDIKNVSGIIEACRKLYTKRKDFELHIVGDGPDRGSLETLAKNYNLLDEVIFFEGMVSNNKIQEFLNKCDFFVINSNFETFSVVTAEALMCGKPVIATKCGGPNEFVNEDCGILIEPRDNDALVKAINYMLDNYIKYDSKKIIRYAKSIFNPLHIGKSFLDIYHDAIST
ncbi:MAG: glycosyltransferase [Methanothrix sp.]|jgi:glycosyltransferase involved in cell wall biosynthesis|uniref:glycosyltransferase n=1 Tax=Methanothrix sp. TaxID=90426 RepID=UPI00247DD42B|nr:glycosyltransferase [Methanothrix sp.]